MDPSKFLQYSPPTGLPQESKLATYMNRSVQRTPNPNHAHGDNILESTPISNKKALLTVSKFGPPNFYTPPPRIPLESPHSPPPSNVVIHPSTPKVHQENVGGTTYFYSTNSDSLNSSTGLNPSGSIAGGSESCLGTPVGAGVIASPYATHMYAPTQMAPTTSKPGLASTFYMPETIRSEIYQRNEDIFLQTDLRAYPDLPENVEMYSDLTPIESAAPHSLATAFRATHRQTAGHYALRRLHGHAPHQSNSKRIEMWKQIDHPNVVRLHDCFTTKAFGDLSTVLVYEYHPACETLLNKYLSGGGGTAVNDNSGFHDPFSSDPDAPRPYTHQKNAMLRAVACGALLPEAELWSLLVQLTAALRAIHTAGLACRSLDPSKVVMNGCRVRIAWCGAADALHPNTSDVVQAQQEDLTALGRLALALACRTVHCDNLPASMELVARTYSADLKNLILYLLSTSTARRSVTDLMPMIGARFYTQVEALEKRADAFEAQLAVEIDNGRLMRILSKLAIVNERPELNMDSSWSETGGRYLLKLFRDYMFHSVTPEGRPYLDQAHLTHCLNHLDSGSNNKVQLMTRDEESVLVVTYAELKHCLEQAFEELMHVAAPGP